MYMSTCIKALCRHVKQNKSHGVGGVGFWRVRGGAIALLGWAGYRLVLWLLRFHGGVATLLDRCGCYIDVTPLLDFHVGVVTFILDRCYVFREGLLY